MTDGEINATEIDNLMSQRKQLIKERKGKFSQDLEDKIEDIENHISEECAQKEFEKLVTVVGI